MKTIRYFSAGLNDIAGDALGSGETELDAINNAIANPRNNLDFNGVKTFAEFEKAFSENFEGDYYVIITENELETTPINGNGDKRLGVKSIPGFDIRFIADFTEDYFSLELDAGYSLKVFERTDEVKPGYSIAFDYYPFLSDLNRIESESEFNALVEKYRFKPV